MKAGSRRTRLALMGTVLVGGLVGLLTLWLLGWPGTAGTDMLAKANGLLPLARPVFAQGAGTTFLDEEAGMSIYADAGQSVDLSVARTKYKTIEKETSDYVVGSFSLPDLPETDDVHCFVHKDGWIAVYYLSEEPVSKVIDWSYYSPGTLSKTKLEVGLDEMCNTLGVNPASVDYYHFQYRFANKWLVIADCASSDALDSFNIKIPGDFTVYERSWSHYAVCHSSSGHSYFEIDGNVINRIYDPGGTNYGTLTAAQLLVVS